MLSKRTDVCCKMSCLYHLMRPKHLRRGSPNTRSSGSKEVVVPKGFAFFKGAHPRLINYWEKVPYYAKPPEQTATDDADLAALQAELGSAAAWDYYYVEPVMTEIMEPIPNAEYISDHQHGGFYIEKSQNDHWHICRQTDDIYGRYVGSAPSRVSALAKAPCIFARLIWPGRPRHFICRETRRVSDAGSSE